MANYKNHLIDPHYFYDAIEEFAFDYDIYVQTGEIIDEFFDKKSTYEKMTIRGSLQTEGTRLVQSLSGNTMTNEYNFYCKSLYRINIGDFIFYKNNWLHVDSVHDYDEWGVRSAHLTMTNLSSYTDLSDYVNYLNGHTTI